MISKKPAMMLLNPKPSPSTSNAYDVPQKFKRLTILIIEIKTSGFKYCHFLIILKTFFIFVSF